MTGAQHDHFPPETPTAWQHLTTAERRERVRQAVQHDGMTYTEAALALHAPSVNAIAGVINRSLASADPIISSSGQKFGGQQQVKRLGAAKARVRKRAKAPKPGKPRHPGFHKFVPLAAPTPAVVEHTPPSAVWLALPGSHPVAIEIHTDGCRWPINEARPFLYCNCQTKNGSVYCPVHSALGFRELPTKTARKETA